MTALAGKFVPAVSVNDRDCVCLASACPQFLSAIVTAFIWQVRARRFVDDRGCDQFYIIIIYIIILNHYLSSVRGFMSTIVATLIWQVHAHSLCQRSWRQVVNGSGVGITILVQIGEYCDVRASMFRSTLYQYCLC